MAATTSLTGTGTSGILPWASVKDATGAVWLAQVSGGNIVAYSPTVSAAVLADNSNNAATDYTSAGMAANPLLWSNGITARAVNSLTVDTTAGAQTINLGAATNVLTLTSGALQVVGANNATLTGGQVGAANAELIVQQNAAGVLTVNSLVSGGTGSLLKLGAGTLVLGAANTYPAPRPSSAARSRPVRPARSALSPPSRLRTPPASSSTPMVIIRPLFP